MTRAGAKIRVFDVRNLRTDAAGGVDVGGAVPGFTAVRDVLRLLAVFSIATAAGLLVFAGTRLLISDRGPLLIAAAAGIGAAGLAGGLAHLVANRGARRKQATEF